MIPCSDTTAKAVVSRSRRFTRSKSDNLDYTTCSRVDSDLLSDLHTVLTSPTESSLLFVAQPEQPWARSYSISSQSQHARGSFDFSTAKSVAHLAHEERRLSIPQTNSSLSLSNLNPAVMAARRPSEPALPKLNTGQPRLRTVGSASYLRVPNDETVISASDLTFSSASSPIEQKKRFRFPKLMVKDKKKRETEVKSCIEISSQIPPNDAEIHANEIPCCPPCDPQDGKSSKYIVERSDWSHLLKAEPGDLACFLAGCPPGLPRCEKHHRRYGSINPQEQAKSQRAPEDYLGVTEGLARDAARVSLAFHGVKLKSHLSSSEASKPKSSTAAGHDHASRFQSRNISSSVGNPSISDQGSSVASGSDAFPHAMQSMELSPNNKQAFSTSIMTNFSLSGRKSAPKYTTARDAIRKRRSETRSQGSLDFYEPYRPPRSGSVARARQELERRSKSEAPLLGQLHSDEGERASKDKVLKELLGSSGNGGSRETKGEMGSVLSEESRSTPPRTPWTSYETRTDDTAPTEFSDRIFEREDWSSSASLKPGPTPGSIRPKKSDQPRSPIAKSPPLLPSAGSKMSGVARHALLKPLATDSQPLDISLPLSPVLSPTLSKPETLGPSEPKLTAVLKAIKDQSSNRDSSDLGGKDSAELKNDDILASSNLQGPTKSTTNEEILLKSDEGADKEPPVPVSESEISAIPQNGDFPLTRAAEESLNAAYWGFVPASRSVIQDVIEDTALDTAHEAGTIAAAMKAETVRKSFRSSKALPASTSAENVDEIPRQALPTSPRGSESTVIRTKANAYSPSTLQSSSRGSVASKGQENEYGLTIKSPTESNIRYDWLGQTPTNFDTCDDIFRPVQLAQCEELENISLDQSKADSLANKGKKPSTEWKKGSGPAYSSIPDRRSSRNKVLSTRTPSSTSKISPKTSLTGRNISDRLATKNSQRLPSITSRGSLISARTGAKDEDPEALMPLIDRSKRSPRLTGTADEKTGVQNTVQWLKELLSSNEPYEARFTSLPPRTRRDQASLNGPTRSSSTPDKQFAEVSLGVTPKLSPFGPVIAHRTVTAKRSKRAEASETFTKTIHNLESLMDEAMLIARQAADTQDPSYTPDALENVAKMLKSVREGVSEDEMSYRFGCGRLQSRGLVARHSDESMPSVHESLRNLSESEWSDTSDEIKYYAPRPPTPPRPTSRDVTMPSKAITLSFKKPASRNPSGWPPTGRGSTPYPPESQLPSNQSPILNSNDSIDKITSVDPQSMSTETAISDPRRRAVSMPPGLRSIVPDVGPRISSRRDTISENGDSTELSDTEVIEFKPPNFSRGRSITLKTQISERSPRRLSPIKSEPLPAENAAPVQSGEPLVDYSVPLPHFTPQGSSPRRCAKGHSEDDHQTVSAKLASKAVPSKREVRDYILEHRRPPIQLRGSSRNLRQEAKKAQERSRAASARTVKTGQTYNWQNIDQSKVEPCSILGSRVTTAALEENKYLPETRSYDGSMQSELDFNTGYVVRQRGGGGDSGKNLAGYDLCDNPDPDLPQTSRGGALKRTAFSLRGKTHVSLKEHHLKGFSLARSHKKQSIARDWSPGRKRFVAFVSCFSTALIGFLVGIYAGQTPSIQYYIVDFHHYTVLGNVFFFIGLAIPTFFCWPLPLLHGRKPYILGSLSIAMPLLFPQALVVGAVRSPYTAIWRVALILPRAAMGFVLGFANMNFRSQLTDVFGASLQSTNPHQEHVDEFDVRRHGGGMGVWLGLWSWSALGSIGVGFMIGAIIINSLSPAWGFYLAIIIIAFVMLLNVLVPETRRSAYRRSVAEVANENGQVSRRLARGEVKMHMVKSGPRWWGEEFHWGVILSLKMLRQPGFMVMAVYVAWIYGQMVLTILLLGALMSRDYKLKSPLVAASATAIPLGALLAIPFQKASIFSRDRHVNNGPTPTHKHIHWSSHMIRRTIFVLVLPFAGLGVTLSAGGPPTPFIVPILFAGLVGFLSNLAMAECHGILMETFDTSDLSPGMTGRARGSSGDKQKAKRTNYSSFPRVQSAFAITQGFGYLIGAAATGVGGALTRDLGAQAALGTMAGVLLILSLMFLAVLVRFTSVQIIPDCKKEEMNRYKQARRASQIRKEEGIEEEEPWRPIIIGNPHHHFRRMNLLELGAMSRYSEIREKNKLVDANSLEAKSPNLAAFRNFENRIYEKEREIVGNIRRSLSRHSSRGSRRSDSVGQPEQGDLGGFREMGGGGSLSRDRSGNGRSGSRRGQGTGVARRKISE